MLNIRNASLADTPAITNIYNDAVLNTTASFDIELRTVEDRKAWFKSHHPKYPVLVAVEDGIIVGWASLSPWSDRRAYAGTVEDSVYVRESSKGNGIGKKLLEELLEQGFKAGFHTVIARIADNNNISIHLHEVFDFKMIGIMKEVGFKFGKLLDVYLMQKIFEE
jgi:L-amino acid N-acyltransferase YncA